MGRPKKTISPLEEVNDENLNAETILAEGTEGENENPTGNDEALVPENDGTTSPANDVPDAEKGDGADKGTESEEENGEKAAVLGPEVNSSVQHLLRIFNGYDELYVSKSGGVFPKNNKPSYVKDAVLYKNPFYKKH